MPREGEREYIREDKRDPTEQIDTHWSPPSRDEGRWMFDYSMLYWEIKARLMGGSLSQDKMRNYMINIPKGAVPIMNTRGIEETMSLINGLVTKIHGLTIVTEDRVHELCRDLMVKLAKLYYVNMTNFALKPEKAYLVIRIIMYLFEANLRKSIQGYSMKMMGQTEKFITTQTEPKRKWWPF